MSKNQILFSRACIDISANPVLIPLNDDDERIVDSDLAFETVEEAEGFCEKNNVFIVNENDIQFFDKNNVLIRNV